jgi:hypothetical protein
VQRRLDIDADLARLDQADRLPELEEAFVKASAGAGQGWALGDIDRR